MASKDYYKELGVEKGATDDELKRAYRNLAKQYHPDRYANKSEDERKQAEDKFKDITEAYSVLSDKEKRQKYDMYGTVDGNPLEGFDFRGMEGMEDLFGAFRNMYSGGFGGFGSFFGGGRQREPQVRQPEPLQIHLRVTISDIFNGTKKHVKYKYMGECQECHGAGHLEGGKIETCPHCHGTGMLSTQEVRGFSTIINQTVCPYCEGTGQSVSNPCKKCNGTGLDVCYEELDIEVPVGAFNGAYIQLSGKGNCAKRHPEVRGNLIVIFDVQEDSRFSIVNQFDLQTQIEVPILDCITGCKQSVEGIDGKKYCFKIEPGTETGKTILLRGIGLKAKNGRGNLIVKVKQKFPKSISKSDAKKIEELKKNFK